MIKVIRKIRDFLLLIKFWIVWSIAYVVFNGLLLVCKTINSIRSKDVL